MGKLIGEILVNAGVISLGQLNEVRRQQMARSETKIGELLIENGLITQEQLETALRKQNELRQNKELSSWA